MSKRGITVDVNFVDEDRTVNLVVPFDWTGRDIVNLVGQLVEQGNERQFYGAIEPTPRHLGNVDFNEETEDAKKFVESQHPRSKTGEFTAGPTGSRAGAVMYHGTNEKSLSMHGKEMHLTPSYEQAMIYARNMHKFDPEGDFDEPDHPVVHKIDVNAGKALNVQKEINHYQTGKSGEHNADTYIAKLADKARSQGYDYLEFDHPNWDGPGTHMVRVALNPDDQLGYSNEVYEQERRKKQRLSTSHDAKFQEAQHPRGQPENKGEFAAKSGATGGSKAKPVAGSGKPVKAAQPPPRLPTAIPPGQGAAFTRAPEDRAKWPAHIKKMVVPPAWSNVHYNPDPNGALQVTGQAQNGKWQPIYHPKYRASQDESKYARAKELDDKFDAIKAKNDKARKSKDPTERDHADVAALIMEMGLRPGGEGTGAAHMSYGASTLEGRHVVQLKNSVRLRFVPGKKHGEKIDLPVENPDIAKMLVQRSAKAGSAGKLFPSVSANSLLAYVHSFDGGSFKTKDLRTVLGTRTAGDAVAKMKAPTNPAEYKKAVKAVCTVVANKLGNTPAVCLSSYVSPVVWTEWRTSAGV